jgi:CBS domain-containing protein
LFAKDIMTTNVVTVGPNSPIGEIAKLLISHHISGVPVVDADDNVVGIVTEGDLVTNFGKDRKTRRPWWLDLIVNHGKSISQNINPTDLTANDVMSRDVISADYFATITSVAEVLEKNRIKRVPVINNGRLIGIISRANIIQLLACHDKDPLGEVAELDRQIRQSIIDNINEHGWSELKLLNVLVCDGVVSFWGLVNSEETRELLGSAAENTTGVRSVKNNVGIATLIDV